MRSKTGITVLLVFFVTVTGIFAQPTPGAYNQWYFGAHARTSIAPPGPITGPTSENTQEGCACYCDQNGAILFYTDGITVWNAAGVACPTQLNGSPNTPGGSAAQGVVIVPMVPQNIHTVNLFYIFTVSDANSATPLNNGLTYYIYSATTNSIISGPSQPTFNSYTTEGLTAIPHCNGQDYWIIVKPVINPTNISPANTFFPNNPFSASDNSIYAYLLDASGLSNTPVISNFLPGQGFYPTTTGNSYNWISTMKSSPDRSLFAIGERAANTGTGGFMNFFSFNCGTGIFDFINRVPQTLFPYGLSFSPDSKNLYACNGAAKVRVYDVSNIACDPTIPHNDLTISNVINDDIYQLQLAPDATTGQVVPNGTILMTHPLTANTTLARFVTPNTPLAPGNYVVNSLFLSPGQSAWVGLPNNIDGQVVNPVPEPVDFTICPCNCKVDFKLTGCGNTISWNFGDGSTVSGTVGAPITPTENTWGNYSAPSHTYVNPGTYVITMVVTTNTPSGPVTQQVGHTVAYNPIGNTCSKWEVSEPSAPLGSSGGNDILTDKYGNVYVGGVFDNNMIFDGLGVCPDITLNGVGPSTRTAYIAKYNNCGELLWVNFENASGTSEGHSLALDPVRDEVYLAGFASGLITFNKVPNSPCGPTIIVGTLSNNGPVYQPFLARFNALTGGYLDGIYGTALPPNIVSFKVPVSIACENTGPLSTDIFYSVAYLTNSIGGGGNIVRVGKINKPAGPYVSLWTQESLPSTIGSHPTVNDLAIWNNGFGSTSVYITGQYEFTFAFPVFPGITIDPQAEKDAYICRLDGATGNVNKLTAFGIGGAVVGSQVANGTSITVNGAGNAFCTGTYNYYTGAPFAGPNPLPAPGNKISTFVTAFNLAATPFWSRRIFSPMGNVMSTGITYNGNKLYISGTTTGNIIVPAAYIPGGLHVGIGLSKRVFVASMNAAGGALWANTTTDATGGNDHLSTRIAANGYYTYTTGSFSGTMNYLTGAPVSGPLVSGINPGTVNTFIVRNEEVFGNFRMQDENEQPQTLDLNEDIKIYPNPTSGNFYLSLPGSENEPCQIEIFDMTGRLIKSIKSEDSLVTLDLSDQSEGIYLVKVVQNAKVMSSKITIQK